MNVLIIGSGGREDALGQKIAESSLSPSLFFLPGNGGTGRYGTNIPGSVMDITGTIAACREHSIDYVVVAPDDPLAAGMVDALKGAGIPVFGPDKRAARIESSKSFAKDLMRKYSIPTASYEVFTDSASAIEYASAQDYPLVIKADGLALGKGVIIAESRTEAEDAIRSMMDDDAFGEAGRKIVIEEFLTGPEFSFMCFVDGERVWPMALSQDHKRAYEGDKGPNTGGMGAYSPLPFITEEDREYAMEHIMKPVASAMVKEGRPFKGVLYGGLMKTPSGIKVIEFNCRFGDPETEVVLPLLKTDIYDIFSAVADGSAMPEIKWEQKSSMGFVMASKGYPGSYEKGFPIEGLEDALSDQQVRIYHMGTAVKDGMTVTSGGRVLMVIGSGDTLLQARDRALAAVDKIRCDNLFWRRDIGWRVL